jgi:phage baseplate assembly protein W
MAESILDSSKVKLKRAQKTFVDVSLAFEANPITKDLTVLLNERAVNNAIKNLIMIAPSEVPFNRDIGSNVRHYLFDLIDPSTAMLLEDEIKRTIRFGEPRAKIERLKVEAREDRNEFMVSLWYKIVGYDEVIFVDYILAPTR